MQMIVNKTKNHEFRKKLYPSTIERIWFYETAPISAITYVCEIAPALIRPPKTSQGGKVDLLPEDGIGNADFNSYRPDYDGYDYAYPVKSCWKLIRPITLRGLKAHGIDGAPRGMVYVPDSLLRKVKWDEQELVWR